MPQPTATAPYEVASAAIASIREQLEPYADGLSVRPTGAMGLIGSTAV